MGSTAAPTNGKTGGGPETDARCRFSALFRQLALGITTDDILDAPGGIVLRTLTSTSPSVVYANADILANFGAVPASLSVAGRGFPPTVTLEIV